MITASAKRKFDQADRPLVGMTIMPDYLQTEGVEAVLDNIVERSGVTAIVLSPCVVEESDEGEREPPSDGGKGMVRLLDRPVWGKREFGINVAPSFQPHMELYKEQRYRAVEPTKLTQRVGHTIEDAIKSAKDRGLDVYFQIQAAAPPGYRAQFGGIDKDDVPLLPNGRLPSRTVDRNGSLASPHIRQYLAALVCDLSRNYPDIDGFRIDWPEYPPYTIDSLFTDFSEHAITAAKRLGYDIERMRRDAIAAMSVLRETENRQFLRDLLQTDGRHLLREFLVGLPGLLDLFHFKSEVATELVAETRRALVADGHGAKKLIPQTFPPPWTLVSGLSFSRMAQHCDGFAVKLFTMHWAMMLNTYGRELIGNLGEHDEEVLVKALVRLLEISDDDGLSSLDDYAYPDPDKAHPTGVGAQARKINQAQTAAGQVPVAALVHGYGTPEDFRNRLTAAWEASPQGLWINRYGYLSDVKLDVIGEVTGTRHVRLADG